MQTNSPVSSFFETWKTIILHPITFFQDMPLEGGIVQPLIFVVCMCALAALGVIVSNVSHLSPALAGTFKAFIGGVVGSFVGAAVSWILCKMFGGNGNFEQTFRAVAYSTAPHAFAVVGPLGLVGTIYSVYLLWLGLKRAHQLSGGKVAAVIGIEIAIVLIAFGLLVAVLFALLAHR